MSSCPTRCEGVREAASRSVQERVRVAVGVALAVVGVGLVVDLEVVELVGVVVEGVVDGADEEVVL
jgi:hypothetical protein